MRRESASPIRLLGVVVQATARPVVVDGARWLIFAPLNPADRRRWAVSCVNGRVVRTDQECDA